MSELSIIGRNASVRGNVRGDGDLEVEGRVDGSIAIQGDLSITESGLIRSDISGRRIVVRGAVAGNVTANESIVLEVGARVVGNLSAPRIGIRPGALVRGQITTAGAEQAPARARSTAATTHAAPVGARPAPRPQASTRVATPVEVRPARPAPVAAPARAPAAAPAPPAHTAPAPAPRAAPSVDAAKAAASKAPPAPVVPSIGKSAKASLKRKSTAK
jgi:cytoskeletal protein CcmA (bactofilin family)